MYKFDSGCVLNSSSNIVIVSKVYVWSKTTEDFNVEADMYTVGRLKPLTG